MRYQVLEPFKVRTSQGEIELKEGQVITLPQEKAIMLIEGGKITPIGRVAYKVYSEILQAYIWVVQDDKNMEALKSKGVSEAVYTADEIERLKEVDKDHLKAIHKVKETFKDSKIEG